MIRPFWLPLPSLSVIPKLMVVNPLKSLARMPTPTSPFALEVMEDLLLEILQPRDLPAIRLSVRI
jgi:hypothetical protein